MNGRDVNDAGATNPGKKKTLLEYLFQQIEEEGLSGEWVVETECLGAITHRRDIALCKLY